MNKIFICFIGVFFAYYSHSSEVLWTANPNSRYEAQQILNYIGRLSSKPEKKVLSGQFMGYAFQIHNRVNNGYDFEIKSLYEKTGKWAAIVGTDFGFSHSPNFAEYCSLLVNYWDAGHLVTISHHSKNPNTSFEKIATDSTWLSTLDWVADRLEYLRDRNVIVLWRPFHEMNGDWFWYGAKSRSHEQFKAMWRHMFDYFSHHRKLDNLIWIYSPDDGRGEVDEHYPGDAYVDIVALDKYNNWNNKLQLGNYQAIKSFNKPIGLGEFSPKRACSHSTCDGFTDIASYDVLLNSLKNDYKDLTFFQAWDREWGMNFNDAYNLLNDPIMLNRDELDWRSLNLNRPKVTLNLLDSSTQFNPAAKITLTATVDSEVADIERIEFYSDSVKIGESKSHPYSFIWYQARSGSYRLNAKVYHKSGLSSVSNSIQIWVGLNLSEGQLIDQITLYDFNHQRHWSVKSNLLPNDQAFGDRPFKIKTFAADLYGAEWISPSMDAKSLTSPPNLITFNMKKNATLYIAHCDRIAEKPIWLKAFEKTAEKLSIDENGVLRELTIYTKSLLRGESVSLGVNSDLGISNAHMYLVFAKEENTTYSINSNSNHKLNIQFINENQRLKIEWGGQIIPNTEFELKAFDLQGKQIYNFKFSAHQIIGRQLQISLDFLLPGKYLLELSSQNTFQNTIISINP
jgi:mannan endo-1,4-beta-mannosidase